MELIVIDRLDMLLTEGAEPKKITKTFGVSMDVAQALDKLRPGVRSKVVDLALRQVLTQKGLLESDDE